MSRDDQTRGPVPVPYPMQGDVAPAHTYYYPDYAIGQPEDEGLQLARLGKLVWRRKLWLLGAMIIGWGVGWTASRLVEPEYLTSTTLAIQDRGTARGGPIQTGQVLPVDGWTDVFTSRAVIGPVVESLGLRLRVLGDIDRELFDSFVIGEEAFAGVYALAVGADGAWELSRDGESGPIEQGSRGETVGTSSGFGWRPALATIEPGTEIEFRLLTQQAAVMGIGGRLDAGFRNRSDIITAELTWHDPYEGAEILNAIAHQFVLLADQLRTTKIREEVALLQEQTDKTIQQLEGAEFRLQAHRVAAITEPTEPLLSPTAGPTGAANDPVFTAFAANKYRADELGMELGQIGAIQRDVAGGQRLNLLALQYVPSATRSAELQAAINELQNAQLNRRTLLFTYTEEEPQVVAQSARIAELEDIIIPGSLIRLSGEIQNQIDLLNSQIRNQGAQLREIPQRTIMTARLRREVTQAAALNGMLLSRLKEAELAAATSGPGISVLNPAWPNPAPRGEKPGGVIALFTVLSLGLAVAGVIVFDRFDRRIHSPDQVTSALGLPVLAVVPQLQAAPDPASPAAAIAVESFRGLRTQIAHVDGKVGGVTLITSPAPREGKSMVSANLAISYATAGHKTLLLDADTRRGRAQEMFNLARSPGLTDYLMDRGTLEEVRQATSVHNLTLLARGAPGGFNADLLEGERMRGLMEQLREEFDMIIMDGPPLAAGTDVLLLGAFVDKVVIVLRAGSTTEDLAKARLGALGNVDLPIVGAVLNALPKSAPDYEYYVNYYYADAV